MPFDIPDSWIWTRIGFISELSNGLASRGSKNGVDTPVLRLTNLSSESINYNSVRLIKLTPNDIKSNYCVSGDLIIIRVNGSRNRVADPFVFDNEKPMCYCDHLIKIRPNSIVLSDYLCLVMKSKFFKDYISELIVTSSGQNTISQSSVKGALLPLPPLEEQKRICRCYKRYLNVAALHIQMLSVVSSSIITIRQSIIMNAIQGKLVSQNSNDPPVHIQCKNPIIRRDNSYYEVTRDGDLCIDSELPFKIPYNWQWYRLKDIVDYGKTGSVVVSDIPDGSFIVELDNIEKDTGRLMGYTKKEDITQTSIRYRFQKGDVLYSKLRPYLNKVLVAEVDGYCTTEITVMRTGLNLLSHYL